MTAPAARPRPRPAARPPSPASEPAQGAAAPATGRVDVDATPPATERPKSHHDCWLEAGGGTDQYDADRYLALMRDAGILRERAGLTEVLRRTVERHRASGAAADDFEGFGHALVKELADEGYRIHDVARCVRVADPLTEGRPMTPEEEATLVPAHGVAPSSGSVAASLPSMRGG